MVFILERLAIGNACEAQELMHEGAGAKEITALLCVANNINDMVVYDDYLFECIPIKDFCPIPAQKMADAIKWISKHIETHKIMVFCKAGIGRSASVIIGYLVSAGFGFGEAVEFVARKKPDISILPRLIETIDEALKILGKN